VPLPGANLVLCFLFVTVLVGGIIRLRIHKRTIGVLIVHIGILLMLVAGFVKAYFSQDGHVTLFEGQRSAHFDSYYRWELVVIEPLEAGGCASTYVPHEMFTDAVGKQPVRIGGGTLPFALEVHDFLPNCRPMPKGPMFNVDVPVVDGMFLRQARSAEGRRARTSPART
jgi:cytochrome c biogenesis protein ResB